ncbi:MAG: helix-turn-helix domain-containing protein [Clostridiales bacterium]|jgi:cytoskeletal protein RodZ|nr:helix-turn-helix domain-containing protein [Clostridiales bacterium]
MKEIGSELRQAREELGISVDEISNRTLIAKKYLLALESGTFTAFPGEVYLKGALRKYATEVGLAPEQLVNRYDESVKGEKTKGKPAPEKAVPKPRATSGIPQNIKIVRTTRRVNKRRLVTVLAVLLFAVFAVRAVYTGLMTGGVTPGVPPVQENPLPDEDPPTNDLPVITPNEPVTPAPPQIRIERDSRQDRVLFHVYNVDSLDVALTFTERCWIRVEADNAYLLEDTFSPGNIKRISANKEIRIRIGNPPGMKVNVGGESLDLPATANAYTLHIEIAEN